MHQATITYDRAMIKKAVRCFWLRFTWKGMIAKALLACSFVILLATGDRSWILGMTGAIFLIGIGIAASLYFTVMSRSLRKLNGLPTKEVRMTFTNERIEISSSDADASLTWPTVQRLWKFPDCWLLFTGGGASFFTLPLKFVDSNTQSFILQQVKANGGRIS